MARQAKEGKWYQKAEMQTCCSLKREEKAMVVLDTRSICVTRCRREKVCVCASLWVVCAWDVWIWKKRQVASGKKQPHAW